MNVVSFIRITLKTSDYIVIYYFTINATATDHPCRIKKVIHVRNCDVKLFSRIFLYKNNFHFVTLDSEKIDRTLFVL